MMSRKNGDLNDADWQKPIVCRGIRGATTVEDNSRDAILEGTRELLMGMILLNNLQPQDIASVIFTTTTDLNAEYPAVAARQLGWHEIPLLCAHEMNVPNSIEKCIRILVMWNTTLAQDEIQHVYIHNAIHLRPDRSIEMHDLIDRISEELARLPKEAL